MAASTVVAFWAVSFLLVITAGADWAYAIAAGLGHRSVLPAVSGLLTGHLLATVVVAAGVAAVVAGSPQVLTVITLAGAAYLLWLGAGAITHPVVPDSSASVSSGFRLRQAARCLGVSGLNPKLFLLFLALLPQFTDPLAPWPVAVQILALGLVHLASCTVVYTGVGKAAQRVLRARRSAARLVCRVSGVAMIIGGALNLEQVLR